MAQLTDQDVQLALIVLKAYWKGELQTDLANELDQAITLLHAKLVAVDSDVVYFDYEDAVYNPEA